MLPSTNFLFGRSYIMCHNVPNWQAPFPSPISSPIHARTLFAPVLRPSSASLPRVIVHALGSTHISPPHSMLGSACGFICGSSVHIWFMCSNNVRQLVHKCYNTIPIRFNTPPALYSERNPSVSNRSYLSCLLGIIQKTIQARMWVTRDVRHESRVCHLGHFDPNTNATGPQNDPKHDSKTIPSLSQTDPMTTTNRSQKRYKMHQCRCR
jgi:hypothetical protein